MLQSSKVEIYRVTPFTELSYMTLYKMERRKRAVYTTLQRLVHVYIHLNPSASIKRRSNSSHKIANFSCSSEPSAPLPKQATEDRGASKECNKEDYKR